MSRKLSILAVAAALTIAASAEARPRPKASKFEANKSFGLGLMIGAPSGLSGKYFLTKDTAFDFGVGAYYHYRDRDGLHIHGDFLWHPAVLTKNEAFWLPIYFGVGARFLDHNDYDSHIGVRGVGGLAFDFQRVPLDIFFELWFAVDLVRDDHYDMSDGAGSLGIRYWF